MNPIDLPFSLFAHESINIDPADVVPTLSQVSTSLSEDLHNVGADSYLVQIITNQIDDLGLIPADATGKITQGNLLMINPVFSNDEAQFYYVQGDADTVTSALTKVAMVGVDDNSSIQVFALPSHIENHHGVARIFDVSMSA